MMREITATVAGDRGMRSHRPRARHGIPCKRRYSGRCEEVATEPACLVMEFPQGETFQARLERGPLPQHDAMALGQTIASGLTAYTAIRSSSNRFSQLASWFQLAKMRLAESVLFVVDNLLAASPSRGASFARWSWRVSKRGRVRHEHCQTALPICPRVVVLCRHPLDAGGKARPPISLE